MPELQVMGPASAQKASIQNFAAEALVMSMKLITENEKKIDQTTGLSHYKR
jgi:hypothetical protein